MGGGGGGEGEVTCHGNVDSSVDINLFHDKFQLLMEHY